MTCQCGGWNGRRHNHVRDSTANYVEERGGAAATEVILPYAAPGADEARLDAVVRAAAAVGRELIDATVVTPLSQEMLRHGLSARVAGAAAAAAASHKRSKYRNISVLPFVLEHYGRWGKDAIAFAKRLAPSPHEGRSRVLAGFYQDIACSIQRSNADAISASVVRMRMRPT